MSDSVQPHRWQPTRLPRPWDSPGKNTGVGCHFLLQCMKVKSESEVTQSCPTLSNPMDCSLPGSSIHGIFPGKSTEVGCHCFLRIMKQWLLKLELSCLYFFPDTKGTPVEFIKIFHMLLCLKKHTAMDSFLFCFSFLEFLTTERENFNC